ncbi:MAG: NnrS family protein [Nitrospinota bacterium]
MQLLTISSAPPPRPERWALLAHGFRPFFLLASGYGSLFLLIWLVIHAGGAPHPARLSPVLWHGHEMVFGFAMAAVCGFLLSASATWSNAAAARGWRLGLAAGAWAAGRAAMWLSGLLPPALVAAIDLLLVPLLAWTLLPVMLAKGARHHLMLLPALALFFLANLLVHLEALGLAPGWGRRGLALGVNLLALLITLFIGRIAPTFLHLARLGGGMRPQPPARPWLEMLAAGSVALFLLGDLFDPEARWVGAVAILAAGIAAGRMIAWRAGAELRKPFIFFLHLGYAWVAAALALTGWAYWGGPLPAESALHAMTAGGVATMILTVMSIVGLLHTGRPPEFPIAVTLAVPLLSAAALLRVAAPVAFTEGYGTALSAAGILWAAAMGTYAVAYWPILTKPRPDGLPG